MKTKFDYVKFILFFAILIFADQTTKLWAVSELKEGKVIEVIPNVFELNYLDGGNTGAAWGILSGKTTIFIIFTIIVTAILIALICKIERLVKNNYSLNIKGFKYVQYTLLILSAGAVGNLIDRISRGYVIDFLYFKLIDFPVFNVADCYVTISCVLLIICCFFGISDEEFNMIFSLKGKNKD